MLLEKPITEGSVISIKLISGEEIIARFDKDDQHGITVTKPLTVSLGPQGLGMIPFVFLGEKETITLQRSHIIVWMPAKKDAADQYMQGTTGIAMV